LPVCRLLFGSLFNGDIVKVVHREVLSIDARLEVRYERRLDVPDCVPVYTGEEGMRFDFIRVVTTQSHLRRGDHVSDQIFSFYAQSDILREDELVAPVDNLAVGVMSILRAERRVSDQAFEHDSSQ